MSKKVYFCTSCRKRVEKVQNLLFVEESKRGFCSENCIVEFFSPYMEVFDQEELEFRHMVGLESSEVGAEIFQNKEIFDQVLYLPSEIWYEKNEIQEEYYTHILNFGDSKELFYIIVCSYFEGEPSFVFFKTVTKSQDLVNKYRKLKRMDDKIVQSEIDSHSSAQSKVVVEEEEGLEDINLPAEFVEDLELKKSEYLADFIEKRQNTDIALEKFLEYDQYLNFTLEDADEEYLREDDSGDEVMTFIKSFQMQGKSFFYIACCIKLTLPQNREKVMIPILAFPSTDHELYTFYAVGKKKNGKLKN